MQTDVTKLTGAFLELPFANSPQNGSSDKTTVHAEQMLLRSDDIRSVNCLFIDIGGGSHCT